MFDFEEKVRELGDRLRKHNLSEVSRGTGLNYQTVHAIANGKSQFPRPDTIRTLEAWLDEREAAA